MESTSRDRLRSFPASQQPASGLLALALAAVLSAPYGTPEAEELRQRQVLGDVEILVAVPHAGEAMQHQTPLDSPAPRADEHHLVVQLFDAATGRQIEDAEVTADVAEKGYAGSRKMLKPTRIDGKPAYGGFFAMPGRVQYRILVQVRRPGAARAVEAQFEYRHHH